MTIVQTAVFTVDKDYQEAFLEKIKRDVASLKAWPGNLAAEGWQGEDKGDSIEFILLSKWNYKTDFEAWLNRPGHKEGHSDPKTQEVRKHVSRKVSTYKVLAD
ncbi:antibiotic biosynthesis monooxygenase family protein [Streptococcus caviae]|uniref:antibiotic biosynthesis monooxygenase family protein n=1 Tax=Streptococcus sp. 'caviae' TaxID=1915004 RepID=UPI00094BC639|nr:antibiotic biosynthesis monooxygenase family protein [Streptococcus sp. 'caviae']OLN83626.1 antibiotic biosynthesis monooxygenase [Streptococcus sp. 'caviae']